jgi:hypothetical protein
MSIQDYKHNTISGVSKLFKDSDTSLLTDEEMDSVIRFFSSYGVKLEPFECQELANLTPEDFKKIFSEKILKNIELGFKGYYGI